MGNFELSLRFLGKKVPFFSHMKLKAETDLNPTRINEYIYSAFRRSQDNDQVILIDPIDNNYKDDPNFVAIQVTLQGIFVSKIYRINILDISTIEIHFLKETNEATKPNFEREFDTKLKKFREKFKKVFPIPKNARRTFLINYRKFQNF